VVYLHHKQSQLVEFLGRVSGLGRKKTSLILEHFTSLEALFHAEDKQVQRILPFFSEKTQKILLRAISQKIYQDPLFPYCSYLEQDWPARLDFLYTPPCGLYFLGDFKILNHSGPWIGIVGTRGASQYALKICEQMIERFKCYDPLIVSGMAMGIDGRAHETALAHQMKTLGVLGTPLEVIYPPENEELFKKMSVDGLLLSELAPGSEMGPWNFPKRNRIIAALSDVLIIVEAPQKSGALITAKHALELGKEIYVIPGPLDSIKNTGGHQLIQQGANLLIHPEEIFERLGCVRGAPKPIHSERDLFENLNVEEKKIVQTLSSGPLHVDKISDLSHLPAPFVAGLLMKLVLQELVRELPGKMFEIIK
jgi:DNA processing protein